MEMIYPKTEKKAIHPIGIFKEGFGFWRRNFLVLSSISLLVDLPIIGLKVWVAPLRTTGVDIFDFPLLLLGWLFGAWGVVAVTMAVDKQGAGKGSKIWENIIGARKRFLPYLGAAILYELSFLLITIIALLICIVISLFGYGYNFTIKEFSLNTSISILLSFLLLLPVYLLVLLYFTIRLSLGGIISVIDDTAGSLIALRRSHALIKRYVTAVVGDYLLLGAVSILFCLAAFFLLSFMGVGIKIQLSYKGVGFWGIFLGNLPFIILGPLWISVMVALYKKLKETVDIKPVIGNQKINC